MPSTIFLAGSSLRNKGIRSNFRKLEHMIFGLIMGFCLALLFVLLISDKPKGLLYNGQKHDDINDPHSSHDHNDAAGPELDMGIHHNEHENSSMAQKLYKEVRVLCWIMTNPQNHKTKALPVKLTWGKRCNKLLFMSSEEDKDLGSIALPVHEGRDNLGVKTNEAFKYIYEHHLNDADWFLKADDDTYTIVENLRYLLYPYSPETAIYFGCKFKPYVNQGYMSGGAGYVLSREAVRRFVEKAIPSKKLCHTDQNGVEDVEIGRCLENVHVIAGDSRDPKAKGRFFPFAPYYHFVPDFMDDKFWYWEYIYYKTDKCIDCSSENAISFHYVSPYNMYVFDYIIYRLRPYGLIITREPLPERLNVGETEPPPLELTQHEDVTPESKKKVHSFGRPK